MRIDTVASIDAADAVGKKSQYEGCMHPQDSETIRKKYRIRFFSQSIRDTGYCKKRGYC